MKALVGIYFEHEIGELLKGERYMHFRTDVNCGYLIIILLDTYAPWQRELVTELAITQEDGRTLHGTG